jgi:hypothetical protein
MYYFEKKNRSFIAYFMQLLAVQQVRTMYDGCNHRQSGGKHLR